MGIKVAITIPSIVEEICINDNVYTIENIKKALALQEKLASLQEREIERPTLTPQKFKQVRQEMGFTQAQMTNWLYLNTKDGQQQNRQVGKWESGTHKIPGPVIKCLELAGIL